MILFQMTFVVLIIFSSIYIKHVKQMLPLPSGFTYRYQYSDKNLKFWINRHKWRTKIGRNKRREGFAVHKAPTWNNMLCCCSWEVILVSWDHVNKQSNQDKNIAPVLVRGPARLPMSTHRDWIVLYKASFVVIINDHTNPTSLARVLAPRTSTHEVWIIYKVLSFLTADYHAVVTSRSLMCMW